MIENPIASRYELMKPFLNERTRRIILGAEATALGWGGISEVSKATGVHRETIASGCREIANKELNKMGHIVSHSRVEDILHKLEYSLQANKKTIEGKTHPDRDSQFEFINKKSKEFLQHGEPVISVDTKKKEIVGNFKNGGKELRPKVETELVKSHDFLIPELGRGKPLISHEVIVNLIASTTTEKGLRDDFHGEWNYSLIPKDQKIVGFISLHPLRVTRGG